MGTASRGAQKEGINYKHQGKEKEKIAHHIYSSKKLFFWGKNYISRKKF